MNSRKANQIGICRVVRATASAAFLLLTAACASAQEEGPDERGTWVADVNPHTKDMFVTDCPCEVGPSINFTCAAKSGFAHAELQDFLGTKGKAGDTADVTFDVDGRVLTRAAKLADFGGHLQPVFDLEMSDPLFDAISTGKRLRLEFKGEHAETELTGSRKAIAAMRDYCVKP